MAQEKKIVIIIIRGIVVALGSLGKAQRVRIEKGDGCGRGSRGKGLILGRIMWSFGIRVNM